MASCILGIGANLGDRHAAVRQAVNRIGQLPRVQLQATSRWIETEPVGGPPSQPSYVNGAVRLETDVTPHELLAATLKIERDMGRRREIRWAPRTVDIDLLLADDAVIHDAQLVVPHPWMAIRRFVAGPAAEVAPEQVHPVFGWSLQHLWQNLLADSPTVAMVGIHAPEQYEIARQVASATGIRWLTIGGAEAKLAVPVEEKAIELAASLRQETVRQIDASPSQHGHLLANWWESPLAELSREGYDQFVEEEQLARVDDALPAANLKLILVRPPTSMTAVARQTQERLLEITTRTSHGPYLILEVNNLSRLEHDLTAAILGMR